MLRKLKIKIGGEEYLVEVEEEVNTSSKPVVNNSNEHSKSTAETKNHDTTNKRKSNTISSENSIGVPVTAPMPGKIGNIMVQVGDHVEANQPILILEALKLENQIVSSVTGTVVEIAVSNGETVNPGDKLISISEEEGN